MGFFNTLGQVIAGTGMKFNFPQIITPLTPYGIGATLAGQSKPFPQPDITAPRWGYEGGTPQSYKAPDVVKFQAQQYAQQLKPINTSTNITSSTIDSGGSRNVSYMPSFTSASDISNEPQAPSYEDIMRSQINAGWDEYTNQLNEMLNTGLPGQRSAQEQIAQEVYTSGVNQLEAQKKSSEEQVAQQQVKNLKDLAANVRNLFQAGNIYLGARGAGDSSAANQYAYAIGKLGTKARGDILAQVNSRLNQIGDIYNSEVNRLESEKNTRIAQIADWFNSAQNQIRGMIGEAGLGRSRDLQALSTNVYNQALQALQQVQAEAANRRSILETWAANNSQNVQQLIANLQAIGQSVPQFQGIQLSMPQVTSQGNYYIPSYGAVNTRERDIFGNIIR